MNIDSIIQSVEKVLNSNIISLVLQGVIAYLAILWIAVIIWVSKDANNRSSSLFFQVFSILIVIILTPLFGLLIYLIIRPSKTLTEKYLEQAQMQILNEEEKKENLEKCPRCEICIHKDYTFCPHCSLKLKKNCFSCKKPYNVSWQICPYCGKKEKSKPKGSKGTEENMKEMEG